MTTLSDYYTSGSAGGEHPTGDEERIDIVVAWAQRVQGEVVDIGCNDGVFSARLKGAGRRITGVDMNGAQLAKARANLDATASFDITTTWPFEDGSLAAIHMGAVIEHVFDYRTMFSEAARVLRPEGKLWISTPNMASLRHRVEVLLGRMPAWYTNYEHIRPWTVGWLDTQLQPLRLHRTRLAGAHGRRWLTYRLIARCAPTLASLFVAEYEKE